MATSLRLVLLLCSFHLGRVACYRLTSPDNVRTSMDFQSINFTCTADVALTGCQFRWWDHNNNTGPLLDLSRGSESRANSAHLDSELTGYSYSGRGLGAGDCGVSLQVIGYKVWMVACRVRAETGGWTYEWSDLYATSLKHLPSTQTPRESVVLPGGEARFMLKAQKPLRYCWFYPPGGLSLVFDKGAQSPDSTGRYRYLGRGLGDGECGLALSNVSEADNGPVRCWIRNLAGTKYDRRYMALIVARLPSPPELTLRYDGDQLTATCVVRQSRPAVLIAWVLGEDIVRWETKDDQAPVDDDASWVWPWDSTTTTQILVLSLESKHQGMNLKCVACNQVFPYDKAVNTSAVINFTDA